MMDKGQIYSELTESFGNLPQGVDKFPIESLLR